MIDAFYIFTKGGLLLWSTQLVKVKGDPVDRLIKEVLLEERVGETQVNLDSYSLKWLVRNEMDLLFVAVYQGILQLSYLESLLSSISKEFVSQVSGDFGKGLHIKRVDFDADFRRIVMKCDKEHKESRRSVVTTRPSEKKAEAAGKGDKKPSGKAGGGDDEDGEEEDGDDAATAAKTVSQAKSAPSKVKKEGTKKGRDWVGSAKVSTAKMEELDFSKGKPDGGDDDAVLAAKKAEFLGSDDEEEWKNRNDDDVESLSSDSEDEAAEKKEAKPTGKMGSLFKSLTSQVKNLTGGAVLTDDDLEPILKTFKTNLMAKNVGVEVADKLAGSVRVSLVGKTTDRFTTMSKTVKKTLQEAMENLLTPKKSIDVLRAAIAAKNAGRVYAVAFLGVNGVGKSTNLAKVAYYLKNRGGLNVMLCACDTFRAGAVEQLKTHGRCLDVPVFDRGYGKDPADVAKQALAHAKDQGVDVVLIDTAGRMQDNEPLMRAIAKLVAVNTPDLVLFVGEALVGNDAIDQVTKFNRALIDFSHDRRNPRGIDGMLLTKYDTVDDKVGAALSMVYVTGQPIVFVGTGQKYTHLRKMLPKEVVKTLLG
eukprot:TRINITY_DN20065_c1_g1_i1.p1 TRINITY_DN20065_c1_g1~~TRINITY_DN20065_c1_g1_i1.p1  ORF type:complete len:589 (-),score=201.24 TRINITY_DN20065_c1_g1_i1:247-2013(-)